MQKTVNIKFLIWIQVAKIAAATMGPQSSGLVGKNLSKRNCNSNVFHYQGKDFGNQYSATSCVVKKVNNIVFVCLQLHANSYF